MQREAPQVAQAVEALWQAYTKLQQMPWAASVSGGALRDPSALERALAERHAARQAALGEDWAAAFYGDEEAALRVLIEQLRSPKTAAAVTAHAPLNAPVLLPDAAQREAALRQEWQNWDARLASAKADIDAIAQSPMPAAAKAQSASRVISQRFEAHEHARARALLLP